jgi:hypothetical protein
MTPRPVTPPQARVLADQASDAIRALNHATFPAAGFPCLQYPSDAYVLLGSIAELAARLPQLFMQVSAFLQRQLQQDFVAIDDGKYYADAFGAIATASHELEGPAATAARRLAITVDTAKQAIAFATYTGPEPGRD